LRIAKTFHASLNFEGGFGFYGIIAAFKSIIKVIVELFPYMFLL